MVHGDGAREKDALNNMMMVDLERSDIVAFDVLQELYDALDVTASPCGLHGRLCGHLCAGRILNRSNWIAEAMDQMAFGAALPLHAEHCLCAFYEEAYQQLQSSSFSFVPMLPEEHHDLKVRLHGMVEWCRGFLTGYGLSGVKQKNISKETHMILVDFYSFLETDIESVNRDNDAERDFMHLYEYVRVAVLTLFSEYHSLVVH